MRIRRLVMLRHGQTDFNLRSRMQGQLDTELSEVGWSQARAAAVALGAPPPLRIVSSDLRRACDTAITLGESTGLPVRADERLRETHLGDWQGMTHAEIDSQVPGARLTWREDATWAPHGGESRVDVATRSLPLIAELVAGEPDWGGPDHRDRPVVLVAHGGLIAALSAALLKLPVDHWPVLGGLGNASWVQLSGHSEHEAAGPDGAGIKWRLDVWNASAEVVGDVL